MSRPKRYESNQVYKATWYSQNRERQRQRNYINSARKRNEVVARLGGKCSNPNCRWMNEDGTLGCTDFRCLNIDHVNGDGKEERKRPNYLREMYKAILDGNCDGRYQLLCCNCNFIKMVQNKEYRRK